MPGPLVGRKVVITKGLSPGAAVAAGRSKSLTINAEPIDVTSDDDLGIRKLLETDVGQKSFDMSFEGVTKNTTFLSDITDGNPVDDYTILITGVGTFVGIFYLTNLEITAPYNDAVTFSVNLQSSGSWTFTAA